MAHQALADDSFEFEIPKLIRERLEKSAERRRETALERKKCALKLRADGLKAAPEED